METTASRSIHALRKTSWNSGKLVWFAFVGKDGDLSSGEINSTTTNEGTHIWLEPSSTSTSTHVAVSECSGMFCRLCRSHSVVSYWTISAISPPSFLFVRVAGVIVVQLGELLPAMVVEDRKKYLMLYVYYKLFPAKHGDTRKSINYLM